MTKYFRIWGKYHEDTGESLIAGTVNGGRIHTREQARGIIAQWEERIRCKEMFPVRDWRIEAYEA
jgi:hypothetical protein